MKPVIFFTDIFLPEELVFAPTGSRVVIQLKTFPPVNGG
ncbi:hypothetical protein DCCM_2761 [Desulfocucumis palustris]|uniref:Uncharacterized protein n=1 Tax=Desulfocucumis palustris TaxID=1898651 RepID=A0A2L2XBR2_9FIRM|nr:hypothetical protein DCCM_2761 [Desulfocucumis palustris]